MAASSVLRSALASTRSRILSSFSSHLPETEAALVQDRVTSLLATTVGRGKCARASLLMDTHSVLDPSASEEEKGRVVRAAAAMEVLQAFLLVADDIVDESETRRGELCWHRRDGIGLSAVNDALLLNVATSEELRGAFKGHPAENSIASTFATTLNRTILGQMMDGATAKKVEQFNWGRYEQIVAHKTSHYSFVLPIQIGMLAAERYNGLSDTMRTSFMIGYLFQCQDDRLDVFGKSTVTGKVGTDIREGKCTWFACRTLDLLKDQPEKKKEFENAYTRGDIQSVLSFYSSLQLEEQFTLFEKNYMKKLDEEIGDLPVEELREVLREVTEKMKKRQK